MFLRMSFVITLVALCSLAPANASAQSVESPQGRTTTVFTEYDSTVEPRLRSDSADATTSHTPAPIEKPIPTPFRDPFYNNDFSYLDATDQAPSDLFDALKRVAIAPCTTLDIGGEYRIRFHDEQNMARGRLNGEDNEFLLQRTRIYGDARYASWLRGYAEFLDATSSFEDFAPRTIEENRADFINLFGEIRLGEISCGPDAANLAVRVGRQELLLGSQRLVSPLDWSNSRRTFDGATLLYRSAAWDVDAFWTRPVPFSQHQFNDHNFDRPDQSQEFFGVFATWHEQPKHTWDFYYLRLEEQDLRGNAIFDTGAHLGSFDTNTLGVRYEGRTCNWLYELEGAYQFGDYLTLDQSAGFYTVGLGYDLTSLPWKPVLWAYFDWASGDSDPTDDDHGTFNQLFPLGHKYLAFMDLLARQNIEDWNFLVTATPCDRVTLLAWWHIFHLEESRDALDNVAGGAIRSDATGRSGTDVGQELDLTVQVRLTRHADLLVGYSHFFAGDFLADASAPPQSANDADFFYVQFSFKF